MVKGEVIVKISPRYKWMRLMDILIDSKTCECSVRCRNPKEAYSGYVSLCRYRSIGDYTYNIMRKFDRLYIYDLPGKKHELDVLIGKDGFYHICHG